MNLIDPPDTSNGYISRQGVREDHSDPVRAIHLTKWLVKASYTDENEEISLVRKNGSLADPHGRNLIRIAKSSRILSSFYPSPHFRDNRI